MIPDLIDESAEMKEDNMKSNSNYKKQQAILLLLEDDPEQRLLLEETSRRHFSEGSLLAICVAESTDEAKTELTKCYKQFPKAMIYAVLDYNMGINEPGKKKPSEALFIDDTFQALLKNGGVVIIYSGYPIQVRQSQIIFDAPRNYENLVLMISAKSSVHLDDMFRLLKATRPGNIPGLKRLADKCKLDFGTVLNFFKKAKRR